MQKNLSKISRDLLLVMLKNTNNPIEVCGIICELTKRNVHSSSVRDEIAAFKKDNSCFWNTYQVSDFAIAALHLLGWEKYSGERSEVRQLIESGLVFN